MIDHDGEAAARQFGGRHRGVRFGKAALQAATARGLIYRRLEEIRFRTGVAVVATAAAVAGIVLGVTAVMMGGGRTPSAASPAAAAGPRPMGTPVAISAASPSGRPAHTRRTAQPVPAAADTPAPPQTHADAPRPASPNAGPAWPGELPSSWHEMPGYPWRGTYPMPWPGGQYPRWPQGPHWPWGDTDGWGAR